MKKIALAAALSMAATTSFAGNLIEPPMAPPVMPPMEVEAQTSSSGAGLIIPLILVALIAAALAD